MKENRSFSVSVCNLAFGLFQASNCPQCAVMCGADNCAHRSHIMIVCFWFCRTLLASWLLVSSRLIARGNVVCNRCNCASLVVSFCVSMYWCLCEWRPVLFCAYWQSDLLKSGFHPIRPNRTDARIIGPQKHIFGLHAENKHPAASFGTSSSLPIGVGLESVNCGRICRFDHKK